LVFCPKTKSAADKVLKEFKEIAIQNNNKADWARYYEIKNSIADLRPPFAGTTHKAQGGTFPAVFIDQLNIRKCRDEYLRARLIYVALTRASKNVYINS
jgi:ATP-dependent exoDNAse (exonuclease V) alpha subunit